MEMKMKILKILKKRIMKRWKKGKKVRQIVHGRKKLVKQEAISKIKRSQ